MINHRNLLAPIRAMDKFLDEFDSISGEFFSNPIFRDSEAMMKSKVSLPKINVKEKEGSYVIEAAVPGLKKEDLVLKVEDNFLVISHKRSDSVEREEENYLLREVSFRQFERIIPFGERIKEDSIKAKLVNGILRIEIEKENKLMDECKKIIEIE